MLNPRKSYPSSSMFTILVLSSLKARPLQVRQNPRPPWQGCARFGTSGTYGAVDQRCGAEFALVRRGRLGQLGDDPDRPGAPLFCSERKNADGSAARVASEVVRAGLAEAAAGHLPAWPEKLTPHVLRHFCASQLYFSGMDLIAIKETLGHVWIATTMNYVHYPPNSYRGCLDHRARPRRRTVDGTDDMRWNLRLAAAHRGIWKASELQAQLAEHGLPKRPGGRSLPPV
jgi:Phage integrase family